MTIEVQVREKCYCCEGTTIDPMGMKCVACEDGYIESWMSLEALKKLAEAVKG